MAKSTVRSDSIRNEQPDSSLQPDGTTVEELKAMLRSRLADLRTGRDPGLSFEDVFGK